MNKGFLTSKVSTEVKHASQGNESENSDVTQLNNTTQGNSGATMLRKAARVLENPSVDVSVPRVDVDDTYVQPNVTDVNVGNDGIEDGNVGVTNTSLSSRSNEVNLNANLDAGLRL